MSNTDPFSPEQLLLQRRFVGAVARRLVADAAQVDDVAQETWLELLTSKAPPRSLSWLRAVVRNVVRQLGRSEGRRRAREEQVARVAPTLAPATDEIAGRLELQRRLIERVLALPALHREIVLLHFYEERTVKQAAARLGIPFETARTRLRRALEELRAHWNGELGGERAGLLALAQLAPLSKVATWGAWIAMAKGSKAALAAAVVVVAAGGWWLWSDSRALHGTAPAATALVAPAGAEAADANAPLAAARVNEPAPALAPPATPTSVDGFGSVRVHVTWLTADSKSTPIPNVPVRLVSEERPPTFVDQVDGMTDGNGDFLADHVPSGSVIATAAGFTAFTGSSDHPRFSERPCARRIAVRANETTEVTLSVFKEAEIDGVVLDPKGAPVAGATIWISSELGGWPVLGGEFGKSDASGRFHLPVVERIHYISAYAPSFAPSPALSLSSRETTDGRLAIELQLLDEGGCIRGRVVDRSARPVGHAFVYASGPWSNPRVLRKGMSGAHPPARTARTHDDGTFEIEGAPVGEVHLVVRARDHAPVWERFTSTARSLKEFDLTLREGGTLEGTLETGDGEPLPGIEVRVAPVQKLPEPRIEVLTAFTRTDDDGHFAVEHLMTVPLEATVDAGEFGTAKLAFTLADGETREWSPELSRGLEIRGRVVDEDGAAFPRWKVEARFEKRESGEKLPASVATASDGRFTIPRCVDKPYEVRVFEPTDDRRNITFSSVVLHGVKAGGEEIEIRVPANRRACAFVSGRVVDADGRPLPRVSLSLYDGGSNDIGFNAGGESGFRLGPFPPGAYHMRLWLEGLPQLELGTRTLTSGQTLDLGTLTMARPGFVEVRATRADGSPPEDGDVSIWNEARDNSEDIGLIGDLFRSEPLAPGRYQLGGGTKMASTWIPFEIVGGQTTQLSVTIAPGAIRSFRLLTASGAQPSRPSR
jgi:RNA polymerase sigma-70 factor (ECF subfamily)